MMNWALVFWCWFGVDLVFGLWLLALGLVFGPHLGLAKCSLVFGLLFDLKTSMFQSVQNEGAGSQNP